MYSELNIYPNEGLYLYLCQLLSNLLSETCLSDWRRHEDICYRLFMGTAVSWIQARDLCANVVTASGKSTVHLMVPNNDFEFDLMGTFSSAIFWIGINDMSTEGNYTDINTNREFLYNGFPIPSQTKGAYPWVDNNHPYHYFDYDCIAYIRITESLTGLFNRRCSKHFEYHYLCEYPLPKE